MKPSSPSSSPSSYCLRALAFVVDASHDAVMAVVPNNDLPSEETSEYSLHAWKSVPTMRDVLFGLQLPLRPPPSRLGGMIWRKRLWVETTFALSMLQPWEKFIVCASPVSFRASLHADSCA